jgi:hypothetical protein
VWICYHPAGTSRGTLEVFKTYCRPCKTKEIASILLPLIFSPELHAEGSAPKDIFPKRGETLDREALAPKLADSLSPCMALTSNNTLPSGYARIFVNGRSEKLDIQLERSTFRDKFIDSCLTDTLKDFIKKDDSPRSWRFTHVVSDCREKKKSGFYDPRNVDCKINIILNNFSENRELKKIIESHWKKEGLEASRTYYNAAQILNLLRMFNH